MAPPTVTPREWNFNRVSCTLNHPAAQGGSGILVVSDYAADGGVTEEPVTAERTTSKVSADGVTHVDTPLDDRMTVKIKVMALSEAAAWMESSQRAQEIRKRAGETLPAITVTIIDRNSGEKFVGINCYWKTMPSRERNREQGEREFVLEAPYGIQSTTPGNSIPSI